MSTVFYPDLKIIPIDSIKLQEYVQKGRMKKLAQAIKEEGILKNPPIVTHFFNDTYLHLDGANRITGVSMLGYVNCLVQTVDYTDPTQVHLLSWSHLVEVDKKRFLTRVEKLPDVRVRPIKSFHHQNLFRSYIICVLVFGDGTIYEVSAKIVFADLIKRMGSFVDLYADSHVERVFSGTPWSMQSIASRFERYPENNVFIAFPTFSPQQVMTLVDQGVLMPAGITRHVVYRRKLNVNLPLSYLDMPIDKANEELQKFLQHRSVRLYEEPIIYFE